MALEFRLQHKMAQSLVMTPQLQQAIKLLQLSHLELAQELGQQLQENPCLEDAADDESPPPAPPIDDDAQAQSPGHNDDADADYDDDAPLVRGHQEPLADEASLSARAADGSATEPGLNFGGEVAWGDSSGGGHDDGESAFASEPTQALVPLSLRQHLQAMVWMHDFVQAERHIALYLCEEVCDSGFLEAGAEARAALACCVSIEVVKHIVGIMQSFDPPGIMAHDLAESLALQLRRRAQPEPLAEAIVVSHLKAIEARRYGQVAKALGQSVASVKRAVGIIATLNPCVGRAFYKGAPQYIVPDLVVHQVGPSPKDLVVSISDEGLPHLKISRYYQRAVRDLDGSDKAYVQEKLRAASWLLKSLQMRQRTLFKVMQSILDFQAGFFEHGIKALRPLILKDVATAVNMHESTISRVTTNKYVATPQGTFELKFFFGSSVATPMGEKIASMCVKDHIGRLIGAENPRAPLSDQKLVEILHDEDIDVARRTVAKYREMLGILSSSRRRRVF